MEISPPPNAGKMTSFLLLVSRFHARSRLFRNSHILFRYLWHICVCSWETKAGLLCFSSPPLTQLASCALLCHSFIQHRVNVVQLWLCPIYHKYSLTPPTKHLSRSSLCHKPAFEIVVKYIGLMSQTTLLVVPEFCHWPTLCAVPFSESTDPPHKMIFSSLLKGSLCFVKMFA